MPGRGPGGDSCPAPRRAQRGMVTVELAIGFITAVFVAASLVSVLLLAVAQAACAESSAQLARLAARGDEQALREARLRAPDGAAIEIEPDQGGVAARVSVEVPVIGLGAVTVAAEAWAALEPGAGP